MAIDYVGSSGVILSTEQKAALQSSLVILQSNYKFRGVKFWGKIFGVKSDYFIVQGVGKDELKDRKTLYRYMIVENAGIFSKFVENLKTEYYFLVVSITAKWTF